MTWLSHDNNNKIEQKKTKNVFEKSAEEKYGNKKKTFKWLRFRSVLRFDGFCKFVRNGHLKCCFGLLSSPSTSIELYSHGVVVHRYLSAIFAVSSSISLHYTIRQNDWEKKQNDYYESSDVNVEFSILNFWYSIWVIIALLFKWVFFESAWELCYLNWRETKRL